ncbi:MAG TPA: hypothetical protein VH835_03690 [Dongiaceae bacterium]|jgi:hypothetical protein
MRKPSAQPGQGAKPYRKCLRLRFRVKEGKMRLLAHERLDMICPPSVGDLPEAGRHGGYWMELRDARDRVLFHRGLESPLGDAVEVHSPDGSIEQVVGPAQDNVFEVLLPDDAKAKDVAFMGESLEPATTRMRTTGAGGLRGAQELARFGLPAKAAPKRKAGARKASARKTGRRTSALHKPAAKKPRGKKPRAKKPAARKSSAKRKTKPRKKGRRR